MITTGKDATEDEAPERILIERRGRVFAIDIELPLEPAKAKRIAEAVEDDAGDAEVTLGDRARLMRVAASGLVTPATMRGILRILAE